MSALTDVRVKFVKPKTSAEVTVRAGLEGAPPMPSTSATQSEFTPTSVMVEYTRTGRRPWRLSHVIVADRTLIAAPELRAAFWAHRPSDMAAMPEWLRRFVDANTPGGVR